MSFSTREMTGFAGPSGGRRSFTLVELLISVALITLLASMSLFALYGVNEHAKELRTRAQIAKLNTLLMEKWEAYRTRTMPIYIPPGTTLNPTTGKSDYAPIAWIKLMAVRESMRMELPERITDIVDPPTTNVINLPWGTTYSVTLPQPAVWKSYDRAIRSRLNPTNPAPANFATRSNHYGNVPANSATNVWSRENQYSECLYLILEATRDGELSALEFLTEEEVGDVDEDKMPEVLDGWGRPIYFLRWAPGYSYYWGIDNKWGNPNTDDNGVTPTDEIYERGLGNANDDEFFSPVQTVDAQIAPDPFDPLRVDMRWNDLVGSNPNRSNDPYALMPLIFSAGQDGQYDIWDADPGFRYTQPGGSAMVNTYASRTSQAFNNDPYLVHVVSGQATHQIGMPIDNAPSGGDGVLGAADNITNHLLITR